MNSPHDAQRLHALSELQILDSGTDAAYQDLVALACQLTRAPVAFITLADRHRLWFKACQGMVVEELPVESSLCHLAILTPQQPFIVEDLQNDPRVAHLRIAPGLERMRAYLGVPLLDPHGIALGTLCVLDDQVRFFEAGQIDSLQRLARQITMLLAQRETLHKLEELDINFSAFMNNGPFIAYIKDRDRRFSYVNEPFLQQLGLTREEVIGEDDYALWPESARFFREADDQVMRELKPHRRIERMNTLDGRRIFWQTYKFPLVTRQGIALAGLSVDVTEHIEQQHLLEASQRQLLDMMQAAEQRSVTDALTGLYNRRAFDLRLAELLTRAEENSLPLSLLLIDVDHFKAYNDAYGHQAGDAALQDISRLLLQSCRDGDASFRYGGEEFALLLPGADLSAAHRVAERCRAAVANHAWSRRAITLSIGAATHKPGMDAYALIERADQALYAAKAAGRNRTAG
ncbi:diguanylate cyclase [Pseudomonas oryzihabitans]|uniref:GGDEF domain-containing protein n=1 Tax=Pseudomonas rhizoryzae TaxID=2571129 RepID=UPI000736EE63|nr:diguanylate cyclase [Pseudomonas rhizoryzae]KTS78548.1 diguanylate cyclase [Pseudomonas psychrotolerans]KTT22442.1 diguanylate cyclase [Pseudomonas psychrotolerans]KTT28448.1 diguanylate cyclase [Pseudomonas psychrotolerans]KTT34788.1 diguanylate cyclase [Pseudomonas psychrotolerans]KTT48096.1 diguanylate cyclase [Pseudomonas psychrotolerans]